MNYKSVFLKFFPEYLFKDQITSIYHRYTFLRYFPNSCILNKVKSLYYNKKTNYFNVILDENTLKFCYWPYGDSLPVKGYLNEFGIKRGDVVIDGGAYQGVFALIASYLVGSKGKVIAFEPDTENYKKLIKNIELNNIKNIIPIKKGLWNDDSVLKFNNLSKDASSLIFDNKKVDSVKVSVVSLDNELERLNLNKINFIKLDVEGAELDVIKGSRRILNANDDVKLVIASYHTVNGEKTCFKLEKMLCELRYDAKTCFSQHLTTYACK